MALRGVYNMQPHPDKGGRVGFQGGPAGCRGSLGVGARGGGGGGAAVDTQVAHVQVASVHCRPAAALRLVSDTRPGSFST